MIRRFTVAFASVLLLACTGGAAQTTSLTQNKIEDLLAAAGVKVPGRAASPQAGQTIAFAGMKEMRLRWESPPSQSDTTTAQAGEATRKFRALKVTKHPDAPPRQRAPELSTEHLVVAGLDEEGLLRSWTIILDPRLLRAEFPDPAGRWKRENFYRTEAEFMVALPDDPAVTRLDFFHPRWNGESFVLDPLGTASIP